MRSQRSCENPRDTLIRYAKAIDEHFDPDTASDTQATDLGVLIASMEDIKDAQARRLSSFTIKVKIGVAKGLCETYMELYGVTPPPPSN
ncbi:MAG: hypothetical protein HZB75_01110 [Candidatus Saccharibacteria bacterium]|jgi:hypothetical protein|nr:MAG: hypothetical protein HZB75_01110 [Candidatus Saccharibacteria bacterium]